MVDRLEQKERYDRELNVVKRARFNQTIEPYQTNEVPEPKFGVEPHTVKELPALPVRERRQDNMLQQHQDNMLEDGEVVSFGQRAQQQQDQQQLQLRQHNISHSPAYPKQKQRCAWVSSLERHSGLLHQPCSYGRQLMFRDGRYPSFPCTCLLILFIRLSSCLFSLGCVRIWRN